MVLTKQMIPQWEERGSERAAGKETGREKRKSKKTEEIGLFFLPAGCLSNQQMKLFRAWRETKLHTNILQTKY